MINKISFINMLNDMQEEAVNYLINNKQHIVIVKSTKFTGKTTIVTKLFNTIEAYPVLYHTGCDPQKREIANKEFIDVLTEYADCQLTVILDEYYDDQIIQYILKHKNISCYIFTNDQYLEIENSYSFYLNKLYDNYKKKYFNLFNGFNWKKMNIKEILYYLEDNTEDSLKNYTLKNENLRTASTSTSIYIKNKDYIVLNKIEFGENNAITYYKEKI